MGIVMKVSDSAVAVFGNTYIDGKVDGDVVAVFGNVELGPNAEIGGDVVPSAARCCATPQPSFMAMCTTFSPAIWAALGWLRTWVQHCLFYGRPLALVPGLGWAWSLAFDLFGALHMPRTVVSRGPSQCVRTFETQPGQPCWPHSSPCC